jgi:hypothetical protein
MYLGHHEQIFEVLAESLYEEALCKGASHYPLNVQRE